MKAWMKGACLLASLLSVVVFCGASDPNGKNASVATPTVPIYVAVNQDIAFPTPNAVGFLQASGTQLLNENNVSTNGFGIQGGFFGTQRLNSLPSLTAPCLYVSDFIY